MYGVEIQTVGSGMMTDKIRSHFTPQLCLQESKSVGEFLRDAVIVYHAPAGCLVFICSAVVHALAQCHIAFACQLMTEICGKEHGVLQEKSQTPVSVYVAGHIGIFSGRTVVIGLHGYSPVQMPVGQGQQMVVHGAWRPVHISPEKMCHRVLQPRISQIDKQGIGIVTLVHKVDKGRQGVLQTVVCGKVISGVSAQPCEEADIHVGLQQ